MERLTEKSYFFTKIISMKLFHYVKMCERASLISSSEILKKCPNASEKERIRGMEENKNFKTSYEKRNKRHLWHNM